MYLRFLKLSSALPKKNPENVCDDKGEANVEREPLGRPATLDSQVLRYVRHHAAEDHGHLAAEGYLITEKNIKTYFDIRY